VKSVRRTPEERLERVRALLKQWDDDRAYYGDTGKPQSPADELRAALEG
jgi:hypothetical protein